MQRKLQGAKRNTQVIESAGESLKKKDFPGYSGGVGGGNGRYSYICFEKVELDCRSINTDQASLVLSKDSAVDIPAQADDDRLENVPAISSVLLEKAQHFNKREGGVKALEHLIMFLLQMSNEVKIKWKPCGGEITKVFWSCCSHNNLNSSPFP